MDFLNCLLFANIDITVILDGWYGDTSRMYFVGEPSKKAKFLTKITYECLWLGIETVKPGSTTGDIGHAIQKHAGSGSGPAGEGPDQALGNA